MAKESSSGGRSTSRGGSSRASTQGQRSGSTTRSAGAQTTAVADAPDDSTAHGATVHLPFVTAEFHRPDMRLPGRQDVTSAAETVRAQLPSTKHALFYGGLAAGTALSLIEWPVALAIGLGTAVVSSDRGQQT
ncbi:hypothetical protein GCM10027174_28030 [Salinifilum aidingensis]